MRTTKTKTQEIFDDLVDQRLARRFKQKLKDKSLLLIKFVDHKGKADSAFIKATSPLDFDKKINNFKATYEDDKGVERTVYVPRSVKFV